jgi:hypothetical protein
VHQVGDPNKLIQSRYWSSDRTQHPEKTTSLNGAVKQSIMQEV